MTVKIYTLLLQKTLNLNDDDGDWLLEFVEAGNYAFIACENLSSTS